MTTASTDLRRRLVELEAQLAQQADAAKTQSALYRIADLGGRSLDMQEFYRGIHAILGELLYAENTYIALYDEQRRQINFAFYVDTVDKETPDPRMWGTLWGRPREGADRVHPANREGTPHHGN